MVRTIPVLMLLLLGACSVEGVTLPSALAVRDEGSPHLRLQRDGTMSFGIRRDF